MRELYQAGAICKDFKRTVNTLFTSLKQITLQLFLGNQCPMNPITVPLSEERDKEISRIRIRPNCRCDLLNILAQL